MALARIITRFPEDAQTLIQDLRARGFEVQTKSPGENFSGSAALEITVEECSAEEAIQLATEAAKRHESVYVAPGALTDRLPVIGVLPFISQPAHGPAFAQAPSSVENEPAGGDLALQKQAAEQPLSPVSQLAAPELPVAGDTALSDLETRLKVEHTPAMAFESEPPRSELASVTPAIELEPLALQPEADIAKIESQGLESETTRADAEPESTSVLAQDSEMPPPTPEVAEIFERPALARFDEEPGSQQPAEPISDGPIWQAFTEPPFAAAPPVAQPSQPSPDAKGAPSATELEQEFVPVVPLTPSAVPAQLRVSRALLSRFPLDDKLFWKTATLAAGVALVGLLLGGLAHRVSPVPSGLVQGSGSRDRQQVPFEKSKQKSKPRTNQWAETKAVRNGGTVAGKAVVEPSSPLAAEPLPHPSETTSAAGKVSLASEKEQLSAKPKRRSGRDDFVAEDTVTRYGRAPAPHEVIEKKPPVQR